MRIFMNKKIWQKIILVILIFLLFQFITTKPVHAIPGDTLLEPVTSLFANLGDGIMEIMQKTIMGMETSGAWIEESSNLWLKIAIIGTAILAACVAVAAIVLSGGAALTVIASAAGALLKIAGVATIVYFTASVIHFGQDRILFARLSINSSKNFSK